MTPYNHSKYRPTWRDIECHERFECVFLIINWFWGEMTQFTARKMVSEPRTWVWVTGVSLWERDCWGTTIWLHTTTLKTGPCSVMLNAIKDLSVSSSSPIGFEVKWHSSQSGTFDYELSKFFFLLSFTQVIYIYIYILLFFSIYIIIIDLFVRVLLLVVVLLLFKKYNEFDDLFFFFLFPTLHLGKRKLFFLL